MGDQVVASLKASNSFAEQLKEIQNAQKVVTVSLASGRDYTGVIGEVNDNHLVLNRLTGKEFFDAMIDVNQIVAIEVRMKYQ
jgi:ferredoxin-fold anticodon binding domain-containing protein